MTLMLPGLTCGVDEIPAHPAYPRPESQAELFPTALDDNPDFHVAATTLRERSWQEIMNHITDKPNWESKVQDEEIRTKWRAEALEHGEETTWGFSEVMADAMIRELGQKGDDYSEHGWIVAFDPGVLKSDTAVSTELKKALQEAVKPLENVPDHAKDWHPGSNGQVLDLVHPSLWPLMYGRTKILDPELVCDEKDPLVDFGLGKVLPEITAETNWAYSKRFQWLPAEIVYDEDGNAKFDSYINNLHPLKYKDLYSIIAKVIDAAIPLWGRTLNSWPVQQRIVYNTVDYVDFDEPEDLEEDEDGYAEDNWGDRMDELRRENLIQPEPSNEKITYESIDIKKKFHAGLQIIVKLANIHLKPGESYAGGSWHVEGQANEHIVSTALYYYDSENITESRLAFRQSGEEDEFHDSIHHKNFHYEQSDHTFLELVYGLENDSSTVHDIGSVLCREGRLLTFPNTVQHRVCPFELEDKSRPGHRKILALFLVDPHVQIISTLKVPPQQKDWWVERILQTKGIPLTQRLPPEVVSHVFSYVDDPMSLETAKEQRAALMEERSRYVEAQDGNFTEASYNLCEH